MASGRTSARTPSLGSWPSASTTESTSEAWAVPCRRDRLADLGHRVATTTKISSTMSVVAAAAFLISVSVRPSKWLKAAFERR
jgi:hypothetical protein